MKNTRNMTARFKGFVRPHVSVRELHESYEMARLELPGDPDEGLILQDQVQARLRRTLEAERKGERGIPAEEAAKRLGLEQGSGVVHVVHNLGGQRPGSTCEEGITMSSSTPRNALYTPTLPTI